MLVMCRVVGLYDDDPVEVCAAIDERDTLCFGVWIAVDASFSEERLLARNTVTDIIGVEVVLWKNRFSNLGTCSASCSSAVG